MSLTASSLQTRPSFTGQAVEQRQTRAQRLVTPLNVRAQAEEQAIARRGALGVLAAAAGVLLRPAVSEAAYGDAARVFGRAATNKTGFVPFAGEGYALLLPSRWNPSREKDFKGVELRYEDNGDAVNNLVVITEKTDKAAIGDFGAPDKFLQQVQYLLGEQVFLGTTSSEGGFKPNKVSSASLLDVSEAEDKNGKKYYKYELLTRTADGDEGGRHQLITAAVGNGTLYILKVQIGDKRWFKGAKKDAEGAWNSFVVA